MSGRGRGGKFSKPKRGGGKHFSRNLRPIDDDGVEKSMWAEPSESEESSSGEASSAESSENGASSRTSPPQPTEQTREERRAAQRARKQAAAARRSGPVQPGDLPPSSDDSGPASAAPGSESEDEADDDDDDDMPANPNHRPTARAQAAKSAVEGPPKPTVKVSEGNTSQLSRREREALQAQQAKARYEKLHAEGKTDVARADLERLALVRKKRQEAADRKEAEDAERKELDKEKREQFARMERQKAQAARRPGNKKKGGKA